MALDDKYLPKYFFAKDQAYELYRVGPSFCSLHGEFIGFSVVGRRIKKSGRTGSSNSVFRLEGINVESQQIIKRWIKENNLEAKYA